MGIVLEAKVYIPNNEDSSYLSLRAINHQRGTDIAPVLDSYNVSILRDRKKAYDKFVVKQKDDKAQAALDANSSSMGQAAISSELHFKRSHRSLVYFLSTDSLLLRSLNYHHIQFIYILVIFLNAIARSWLMMTGWNGNIWLHEDVGKV